METANFHQWRTTHLFIEQYIVYPEGEECRWVKFNTHWHEKNKIDQTINHLYTYTLDQQTGDIYLNCSPRTILAKCVALSMGRPLFGLVKTAYHLCLPISLPIEIFTAISEGINAGKPYQEMIDSAWNNVKDNVADIIRTPIYTLAMTIISIVAVLIGPFASAKNIYDLRALAGRLELELNRSDDSAWILAPCFQPLSNLMDIHRFDLNKGDTDYHLHSNPTLKGCTNLTRKIIRFNRTHANIFSVCK